MTKLIKTYKKFDIVVVPFPFTDTSATKRRPALILSSENFNQANAHSVMAMITSASHSSWLLDVEISDLSQAGLNSPSIVRMKLFTLDHQLIYKTIGRLSTNDQIIVESSLRSLLT